VSSEKERNIGLAGLDLDLDLNLIGIELGLDWIELDREGVLISIYLYICYVYRIG
jgi:hypothetical protein